MLQTDSQYVHGQVCVNPLNPNRGSKKDIPGGVVEGIQLRSRVPLKLGIKEFGRSPHMPHQSILIKMSNSSDPLVLHFRDAQAMVSTWALCYQFNSQ
mmetsp:Transcript_13926/g.28513  ORF Transcript_13926/g.28513 Transcript_13926/m.28513 type:complete len:97 (+) Transcript_13926:269-559(+)